MRIIVQKYGGSSVATVKRIQRVAKRIVELKDQNTAVVVVVSAMGKTTDKLVAKAHSITEQPKVREYDMLLATGEQVSIALVTMAIDALGCEAVSLTGAQAGIITDNVHGKATISEIHTERIMKLLNEGKIVIVAGFQGVNLEDDITTLGRGGSDTTAVALAAALKAELCEILTDVDGVYSADPNKIDSARKLDEISYDEMLELASLGAKVLHPRSVELAKEYGVDLHVRSSFNMREGTIVKEEETLEKKRIVSGIASDPKIAKVSVLGVPDRPGIAATIFGALAEAHINVDIIVQNVNREGINDISFTISRDDADHAVATLKKLPQDMCAGGVVVDDKIAKVSIVGAGMISRPGVAAGMFRALADEGINIDMISTSEIRVSCIIARNRADDAVSALHRAFESDLA
ncbi:MAG: aspartate kinase [bacterium]